MLLELETAGLGTGLETAVDLLDLGVVVHLDAVPIDGRTRLLRDLAIFPLGRLEGDVEGLPCPVGAPGVLVRNAVHAERGDAMGTYLPVVRILGVLVFGPHCLLRGNGRADHRKHGQQSNAFLALLRNYINSLVSRWFYVNQKAGEQFAWRARYSVSLDDSSFSMSLPIQ